MKGLAQYLQKTFTVHYADTLFPLNWEALKETRCPICNCKLHLSLKKLYTCSSVKHIKPFILKEKQFNEILKKLP